MSYQVTYITTTQTGAPTYDDWIATLDLSTLEKLPIPGVKIPYYLDAVNEFKRLAGDKTAQQIEADVLNMILDPSLGYISSDVPAANDLVEDWASADDYSHAQNGVKLSSATGTISFTKGTNTIIGNGTKFTTEVSVNNDIVIVSNGNSLTVGTVSSIVNDTELTLSSNTRANDTVDTIFSVYENQLYLTFLRQVYNALYVESTTITTSDI